jgi:hypothetical protein
MVGSPICNVSNATEINRITHIKHVHNSKSNPSTKWESNSKNHTHNHENKNIVPLEHFLSYYD